MRLSQVRPVFDGLGDATVLGRHITSLRNGYNLPATSYADPEEEPRSLYVSVGAFSSFVLRVEDCIPLRTDPSAEGLEAVAASEVLVSRSGTPGIAWPGAIHEAEALPIVPSGFVMRMGLAPSIAPEYVAAILNHPAWRLHLGALAAGKRQDNLGQRTLLSVPIPNLGRRAEKRIGAEYRAALLRIGQAFDDSGNFARVCDEVLAATLGLSSEKLPTKPRLRTSAVSLREVANTRALRIDNRWHGPTNRAVLEQLAQSESIPLAELLNEAPAKGRQPHLLSGDEADEAPDRAIATSTIQDGQVLFELAKPTNPGSIDAFPVLPGDLLVAMDGDGSLGKAAVFGGGYDATVDSHVARCRAAGDSLAQALSCFLNSTWGRTQSDGLMTGATGQTQVSPSDLCDLVVPLSLKQNAKAVASAFDGLLGAWEPATRAARRILCEFAAGLTKSLIDEGAIAPAAGRRFQSAENLLALLDGLSPSTPR